VHMLDAKRYAPMNARDKMPFEVTPVFYKLQRYETAHATPPPVPAASAPAASTPTAENQPAATQDNAQPAAQPTQGNELTLPQGTQTTATAQGPQ